MAKIDLKQKKLTKDSILRFFNIKKSKITEVVKPQDQHIRVHNYNEHELSLLAGTKKDKIKQQSVTTNPLEYVELISHNTAEIVRNNKQLYQINPELVQARDIIVQSILSPNDIQTGEITVTSNIEGLDDTTQSELNDYLNKLFNEEVGLGVKLQEWLNDTLFMTGSKPIVVMPRSNIRNIVAAVDVSQVKSYGYENIIETEIVSLGSVVLDEYLEDDIFSEVTEKNLQLIATETLKQSNKILKNNMNNLEISFDATALFKSRQNLGKTKKKIDDSWAKFFDVLGDTKMMYMDDSEKLEENDHPVLIEFPSISVVPITVPGSVSEHIGYFVMTDEYGTPLSDDELIDSASHTSTSRVIKSAFAAQAGSTRYLKDLKDQQLTTAASAAFSATVKHMLDRTLGEVGLNGVTISKYDAISNCLLSKMISKQKVKLIYVPESIMVYYCFGNRVDGTGKSMIEDISYILSLKGTLIVAEVMSALRDAIDTKVVEIELDPKDTNIEQTLNTLTEMYIRKHMPRFTNDPSAITRDIVANSLSIIPKNIPGLENSLTVTSDRKTAGSARPDTDLIEKLDERSKLALGLTPSAINQLNEAEYAVSVATNNLYFSNMIRGMQRKVKTFNDKLARNYIRYSKPIQTRLKSILKIAKISKSDDETKEAVQLNRVIDNLSVVLPRCNTSTAKALSNELNEQITLIETVIEKLYEDDLIAGEDRDLKDTIVTIRSHMKAKAVREFVERLGLKEAISVPTIEDMDITDITNMHLFAKNIKNISDNINDAVVKAEDNM